MTKKIRQLGIADVEKVYSVAEKTLFPLWSKQEYGHFLSQSSSFCWGIEDSLGLASFVLSLSSGAELDIVSVATRTDVQGNGLASHLVKNLLEAQEVEQAFLEVDPTNEAAVRLYLGLGFVVLGIRKKYYQGKKDAWVMKWKR